MEKSHFGFLGVAMVTLETRSSLGRLSRLSDGGLGLVQHGMKGSYTTKERVQRKKERPSPHRFRYREKEPHKEDLSTFEMSPARE